MWLPIFVCFFRVCFVAWLLLLLPLLLQQHLDFMPPFMLVFIVESYLPRIKRLDKLFRSRKKQQLISLSFLFLSLLSRSHSLSLSCFDTHSLSPSSPSRCFFYLDRNSSKYCINNHNKNKKNNCNALFVVG